MDTELIFFNSDFRYILYLPVHGRYFKLARAMRSLTIQH